MYTRTESYDTAWLKAERDLAISSYELPLESLVSPSPKDDILPILNEKIIKDIQRNPTKLENYRPGVSRAIVLDALKKVAKSPKPSRKYGGQPVSTSS